MHMTMKTELSLYKTTFSQCTSLWRGTEFPKAVLKAELHFHRYVHFACVPIYINSNEPEINPCRTTAFTSSQWKFDH